MSFFTPVVDHPSHEERRRKKDPFVFDVPIEGFHYGVSKESFEGFQLVRADTESIFPVGLRQLSENWHGLNLKQQQGYETKGLLTYRWLAG